MPWPLLLVLARLVAPTAAPADPTAELELSWDAPEECPDAGEVRSRIAALLASVGAQGSPQALRVRGIVETTAAAGARLELQIRDASGDARRVLEGLDCAEVTEAAVLIVAMAIEPSVVDALPPPADTDPRGEPEPPGIPSPEREPEPEPEPEPAASLAPIDRDPRAPIATRSAVAPPGFGADAEGGVGIGPLPAISGVIAVRLGLRGRSFRVDATGTYWTPRRGGSPAIGVRAQLWSLGARGCGVPRSGRIEVPLCAGLAAGLMHARGRGGGLAPSRAASPWAAALASAALVVRVLPWLGVRLGVEGHVALARPAFHTEPSGARIHRAGAGGVAIRAGLDFAVPRPR